MLLYGGRFYCAASLLNDQFLLTASHCVYGFRKERISVKCRFQMLAKRLGDQFAESHASESVVSLWRKPEKV